MLITPLEMEAGDWILSSYLSKSCCILGRGMSMVDCRKVVVDVVAVVVDVEPDGRTIVVPFCWSSIEEVFELVGCFEDIFWGFEWVGNI